VGPNQDQTIQFLAFFFLLEKFSVSSITQYLIVLGLPAGTESPSGSREASHASTTTKRPRQTGTHNEGGANFIENRFLPLFYTKTKSKINFACGGTKPRPNNTTPSFLFCCKSSVSSNSIPYCTKVTLREQKVSTGIYLPVVFANPSGSRAKYRSYR
jgi:hypothetical protein